MVDRVTPEYAGDVEIFVYRDVNSDADANRFASTQSIRAIPTMVFVDGDGVEVKRVVGSISEGDLRAILDKLTE